MIASWVAFSCPHLPLIDQDSREFLLETLLEEQPDYVVGMGDWFEADAVSRFESDYDWELEEEYDAVASLMMDIERAAPYAKKVFLEGNHDYNIRDWKRSGKKIAGLIDYRKNEIIGGLLRGDQWEWRPYDQSPKGLYRIGQVGFIHGYSTGPNVDENQGLRECFRMPHGLLLQAHTHRPRQVTQAKKTPSGYLSLDYYYGNVGCLRDLNPEYMRKHNKDGWGNALAVGKSELWRYDKTMIPNAPCWEAEVRVLKMFGDDDE